MSVTAAQGFAASGVRAGIRRDSLDLAVVHSTVPCVGGAMFTACWMRTRSPIRVSWDTATRGPTSECAPICARSATRA